MWSLNTFLAEKLAWYKTWMQNPHSSPIHLALFGLFSIFAFLVVFGEVSRLLVMQEEANMAVVSLAQKPATAVSPERSNARDMETAEVIIGYAPSISESRRSEVATAMLLTKQGDIPALNAVIYTANVDDTVQEVVDRVRHVHGKDLVFVEPNRRLTPELIPNDALYSTQWQIGKIGVDRVWDTSQGEGKTVAIVDTGVDCAHPELVNNCLPGFNTASNNTNASDVYGHGTKVSGVVAAAADNTIGVAGAAYQAKILPVRITNDSQGMASYSDIANGILYATDNGADIINVSYAAYDSQTIVAAAAYAASKGKLITMAAGNTDLVSITKNDPNIIVVSATDSNDARTSWSTYGSPVDIAAPGTDISTTAPGDGFISMSGTSFSSPLVAAVAALVWSNTPGLSSNEIIRVLLGAAHDQAATGYDEEYGFGRVDALAALQSAVAGVIPTITYPSNNQGQQLSLTSYAVVSKTRDAGVVAWATNVSATGRVHYGTSITALSKIVTVDTASTTQQASIIGLDPRKKYYYQIEAMTASGETVKSPVTEFRTRRK